MDEEFQQNDDLPRGGGHHFRPHHRRGHLGSILKTAALIIVIIIIVGFLALTWHGIPTLTSNQTFSVMSGQSAYFKLKGDPNTYALFLKNSSSAYAIIYISKVPVLTNPIITFDLVNGQSDNISTSGSSIANLEVKLASSTLKGAEIELITIPSAFTLQTSSGVVVRNPASFYSGNSSQQQVTIPPPASTTNSTASKNTTSTSTNTTKTTTTTTTSAPVLTPLDNVSGVLNSTYIGVLMNEYNALYVKDRACTSQVYGSDLQIYAGQQPVGPFDFANASAATPTGIAANATALSSTDYHITYSVEAPSTSLSGVAASFNLSTTTGIVSGLAFKGVYFDLNYSDLQNNYEFQNGISGNCGAYIP